jgi:flagellar basal-body rod protein FlgC
MPTLSSAINASATGLDAQRARMEVAISNMANAESTRGADGQPYRRREVVLESKPFESSFDPSVTPCRGARGRDPRG